MADKESSKVSLKGEEKNKHADSGAAAAAAGGNQVRCGK